MSKVQLIPTREQISHYEFVLQKHCDYWLENQIIMLSSVPEMLKKWRIVVNRISKVRQTTCSWIMKILDEATRIVNVFLISWFFYLFLLCSISLLVKYDFILRYEPWVSASRASSFIENFPQISAKPIAFQRKFGWEASTKSAVLYQPFFSKTGLENSHEILAKSAVFSVNLSLKMLLNFFFHDLPEALSYS